MSYLHEHFRLPFSVSFIFGIRLFKSAFMKTIPYVGISAFYLLKGFCIHKSIQNSQMSVFFLLLAKVWWKSPNTVLFQNIQNGYPKIFSKYCDNPKISDLGL